MDRVSRAGLNTQTWKAQNPAAGLDPSAVLLGMITLLRPGMSWHFDLSREAEIRLWRDLTMLRNIREEENRYQESLNVFVSVEFRVLGRRHCNRQLGVQRLAVGN
jgi:hypothetical protein